MTEADKCLEKYKKQLQEFKTQLRIKPNPNNYPIVDKWNHKALRPHLKEIFDMMERAVDEYIGLMNPEEDITYFKYMATIDDLGKPRF